jgi:hypothetical protein
MFPQLSLQTSSAIQLKMETAGNLFMRIPAELRSIIYEYALTEDHPLSPN